MSADGTDKNFGPVYIMIPNVNQIYHLVRSYKVIKTNT